MCSGTVQLSSAAAVADDGDESGLRRSDEIQIVLRPFCSREKRPHHPKGALRWSRLAWKMLPPFL